jgi:predicted transcriptional regulator
MVPDAGALVREARGRNGISQETLARRARTTQKQISRIERGEISPSVSTVSRLLAAMGERLELRAVPRPATTVRTTTCVPTSRSSLRPSGSPRPPRSAVR